MGKSKNPGGQKVNKVRSKLKTKKIHIKYAIFTRKIILDKSKSDRSLQCNPVLSTKITQKLMNLAVLSMHIPGFDWIDQHKLRTKIAQNVTKNTLFAHKCNINSVAYYRGFCKHVKQLCKVQYIRSNLDPDMRTFKTIKTRKK